MGIGVVTGLHRLAVRRACGLDRSLARPGNRAPAQPCGQHAKPFLWRDSHRHEVHRIGHGRRSAAQEAAQHTAGSLVTQPHFGRCSLRRAAFGYGALVEAVIVQCIEQNVGVFLLGLGKRSVGGIKAIAKPLAAGLSYKLLLGPALIYLLYVTILGNNVTLDGQNLYRAFNINSGTAVIENLTITQALARGGDGGSGDNVNGGGGGGAGLGGGIYVNMGATLTITNVNVSFFEGFTPVQNPITLRYRNVPKIRTVPLIDIISTITANPAPCFQRRRGLIP